MRKRKPTFKHLGIKVPLDTYKYVAETAAERQTGKSTIVREALRDHQQKWEAR